MAGPVGNEIVLVQGVAQNGQLSGQQETFTTGQIAALSSANPNAPIAAGASVTASAGKSYLLNTASGSTLTLPAATGTGATIKAFVTTTVTSNSHKVLAASTADFLEGIIITEDTGTCTGWYAAISSSYCSLQLNGTTTGGFQGDWFEFQDIAANTWAVKGMSKSTGTAATPFSTADT
jgi:hypothetical protein